MSITMEKIEDIEINKLLDELHDSEKLNGLSERDKANFLVACRFALSAADAVREGNVAAVLTRIDCANDFSRDISADGVLTLYKR